MDSTGAHTAQDTLRIPRQTVENLIASAPEWQQPIWLAMRCGAAVQMVGKTSQNVPRPLRDRGSVLLVLDDEGSQPGDSLGPNGYPKSLRRALRHVNAVAIIATEPVPEIYAAAALLAVAGACVCLIETRQRWEADWISIIEEHAPRASKIATVSGREGAVQ